MKKNPRKTKSTKNSILWACFYVFLVLSVSLSSCVLFVRYNYSPVYIDGTSMAPTLNSDETTGRKDFGFVDQSEKCIDNISRFDIITCYYPFADEKDYAQPYEKGFEPLPTATHKIKRVMAVPGDTFQIINNEVFYYEDQNDPVGTKATLNFEINIGVSGTRINTQKVTMGEDEYFVMGDNWIASKDCADNNKPIYRDNIIGVLICIVGTCKVKNGPDNTHVITDKQYHWPVFYK